MRSIYALSLSLVIFFSAFAANATYVFVGNGGEGYKTDGALFTRDLFDYDLHANPWIGKDADPLLTQRITAWNSLGLSEKEILLLSQKLTDLNSAYNYLGDDLLMVLEYFHWTYSNDKFILLEPDEIRKPIDSTNRVAIANRFMNSIVIHRDSFQKLDSANKIALLLHEAIYSITRINYKDNGHGYVSLSIVRLLTASLFSEKSLNMSSTLALLKNNLRLSLHSETMRGFSGSYIEVRFFDRKDSSSEAFRHIFPMSVFEESSNLPDMCRKFLHEENRLLTAVEVRLLTKVVVAETYTHDVGSQNALRVQVIPAGYMNFRLQTKSTSDCETTIRENIKKRFGTER